jgi:hypothetical protein
MVLGFSREWNAKQFTRNVEQRRVFSRSEFASLFEFVHHLFSELPRKHEGSEVT